MENPENLECQVDRLNALLYDVIAEFEQPSMNMSILTDDVESPDNSILNSSMFLSPNIKNQFSQDNDSIYVTYETDIFMPDRWLM